MRAQCICLRKVLDRRTSHVRPEVEDALGREAATLVDEEQNAGQRIVVLPHEHRQ
jgi:hypothetical protein